MGVRRSYQLASFVIHCGVQPLGIWLFPSTFFKRNQPDHVIEPKLFDLSVCHLRHFLKVILSSGCNTVKNDAFGNSSSKSHTHSVHKLIWAIQFFVYWSVLS